MVSSLLALPQEFFGEAEVPGTSNVAGADGPFQRWYNFKEAFAPSFVEEVLVSMPHRVMTCLDPFGGSGTTALTCQLLGVRPTTIEVSPFLADLIEAKLSTYNINDLCSDWLSVVDRCRVAELIDDKPQFLFPGAPATFVEPGVRGRWIFDADVAHRIRLYRDAIAEVRDPRNRRLLTVLLGSVLIPVSNVYISGKGRRYRSNWQERRRSAVEVDEMLEAAFQNALYDLCRYGHRPCTSYRVLRGDCRSCIPAAEPADLALFSPPYANSFDYTDIYNVELWALGYLKGAQDNKSLREATLRSHVQIKRQFADGDLGSPTLAHTLERLHDAKDTLWDRNIPGMIAAYFEDLSSVLRDARRVLSQHGQIVMVVGDSSYAGILVDVPGIVAELIPRLGLRCEEIREVRSMRNSPQHGGELALSESLIRLSPA